MSAKKKKKKKKGSLVILLVVLLLIAAVAGVVAWQLRGMCAGSATTAIARSDSLGNYYTGTVVIARNETLYETENMTQIDFVAEEGSRVNRTGVICRVYSSGYNQTEISRLQTYREEIQNYHVNQVLSTYVDAALDSENAEIATLSQQVRTLVQG